MSVLSNDSISKITKIEALDEEKIKDVKPNFEMLKKLIEEDESKKQDEAIKVESLNLNYKNDENSNKLKPKNNVVEEPKNNVVHVDELKNVINNIKKEQKIEYDNKENINKMQDELKEDEKLKITTNVDEAATLTNYSKKNNNVSDSSSFVENNKAKHGDHDKETKQTSQVNTEEILQYLKKIDNRITKLEAAVNKNSTANESIPNNLDRIEETFKKFEKLTYLEKVISSIDTSNQNYNEKIEEINKKILDIQINADFASNVRMLLDMSAKQSRETTEILSQVSFELIMLTTLSGYLIPFNNERDGDDMFRRYISDLDRKAKEIGIEGDEVDNDDLIDEDGKTEDEEK